MLLAEQQAQALLGQARSLMTAADQDADFLVRKQQEVKKVEDGDTIAQRQTELEGGQDQLASVLAQLFEVFGEDVSEKVKQGVNSVGIITYMQSMASGAQIEGIDRAKLDSLWNSDQDLKDWIKDRFRAASPGQHKWIPSNMIMEVINRTAGAEDGVEAADRITVQHKLRTDTHWVIFKPSQAIRNVEELEKADGEKEGEGKKQTFSLLQGHIGALYWRNNQQTVGTNRFHNALRQPFRASQTIAQCLDELKQVFETWVWNGEETHFPIHPELEDSEGNFLAHDQGTVISLQQDRYTEMNNHFDSLKPA